LLVLGEKLVEFGFIHAGSMAWAGSESRWGHRTRTAVMESFFGTFKQEMANHARWNNKEEARAATKEYIEVFYNGQRIHSALGYKTPREVDEAAA